MSSSDTPKPQIEFPCPDYPIKVMGECSTHYKSDVLSVLSSLGTHFDASKISERESSKGRFQSITIFITATGVEQLDALHKALVAMPATRLVL